MSSSRACSRSSHRGGTSSSSIRPGSRLRSPSRRSRPSRSGSCSGPRARAAPPSPVALSQLAGNALSKIIPGGPRRPERSSTGCSRGRDPESTDRLSARRRLRLLFASVLALPLLSLPAILGDARRPRSRRRHSSASAFFLLMLAAGVAAFVWTAPPRFRPPREVALNRTVRRQQHVQGLPERFLQERNALLKAFGRDWKAASRRPPARSSTTSRSSPACARSEPSRSRRSSCSPLVAAAFLGMIPLTPGGLGFVEAGLTGMLALAGSPAPRRHVATLAYRLISFWLPIPAGGVAYGVFSEGGTGERHGIAVRPAVCISLRARRTVLAWLSSPTSRPARSPAPEVVAALVAEAYERFRDHGGGTNSRVYPALERASAELSASAWLRRTDASPQRVTSTSVWHHERREALRLRALCESVGVAEARGPRRRQRDSAFLRPGPAAVEQSRDGRTNPMVNAGAIATTSLIPGATPEARWELLATACPASPAVSLLDDEAYESASRTNHRNREISGLLEQAGSRAIRRWSSISTRGRAACASPPVTSRSWARRSRPAASTRSRASAWSRPRPAGVRSP